MINAPGPRPLPHCKSFRGVIDAVLFPASHDFPLLFCLRCFDVVIFVLCLMIE